MTAQSAPRSIPATGCPLRFAGARAQHNRRRQMLAQQRRTEVVRLLCSADFKQRGWRAAIARELNVSRWTIARDVRRIARDAKEQRAEELNKREREAFRIIAWLQSSLGLEVQP